MKWKNTSKIYTKFPGELREYMGKTLKPNSGWDTEAQNLPEKENGKIKAAQKIERA